jgi:hypothetical protein
MAVNQADEKLNINDDQSVHLYANLVSFHVNPEEICLGMGIRNVQDPQRVDVHSYIHLTIPHFLRFADTVNKQVELLIEKGVITRETEQ